MFRLFPAKVANVVVVSNRNHSVFACGVFLDVDDTVLSNEVHASAKNFSTENTL